MVYRNGGDINVTIFLGLNMYYRNINNSSKELYFENPENICTIFTTYCYLALFCRMSLIRSHHAKMSIYFTGCSA